VGESLDFKTRAVGLWIEIKKRKRPLFLKMQKPRLTAAVFATRKEERKNEKEILNRLILL